ncbi:MAG: hypothetical protein HC809_14240 [Gammaproteobacteria bacterium]|nr:hypothetical protein [Gammaproteobacteria bacterium]
MTDTPRTDTPSYHSPVAAIDGPRDYFMALQDIICAELERLDGATKFSRGHIPSAEGG